MECNNGSDDGTSFKVAAAMLLIGLLFVVIMIAMLYFTVEVVIGRMDFCTLWTDIPGRLAIFLIGYYVAGICGYLPIPERFLLSCLPEPLMLWRIETWTNIFRNIIYSINRLRVNDQDSSELPLVQERYYDCLPTLRRQSEPSLRGQSEPTPIIYPKNKAVPANIPSIDAPKSESPNSSRSSNESLLSFDSPIGGFIVPMVKGKSSKLPYLLGSYKSGSESTTEQTEVANEPKEKPDTPPKTADNEIQLPDYPRFPWGLLRQPKKIPKVAEEIHKRNLRIERREAIKYVRKEKALQQNAARKADSSTDIGWETDDVSALQRLPFRLPSQRFPSRGKIHSRLRTRSMTGDLEKCRPFTLHRKGYSGKSKQNISSDASQSSGTAKSKQVSDATEQEEKNPKCCEKSPDLHLKVKHIQKLMSRISGSSQTGAEISAMSGSRKNIETESSREVPEKVDKKGVYKSSVVPIRSSQAEATKRPDVKILIKSPKHESRKDDNASKPK